MNHALYWVKKPKNEENRPEKLEEGAGSIILMEAGPETKPEGRKIGFWIIPHENSYVKLPIFDSYSITIPGWLMGKTLQLDVKFGGDYCPIWAIVVHRQVLGGHFPWLIRAFNYAGLSDLFNPESEKHDEAVQAFQRTVIGRGWAFWLQLGDKGMFCGDRESDSSKAFFQELGGGKPAIPEELVTDYANVAKITLLSDEGRKVKDVPTGSLAIRPAEPKVDKNTKKVPTLRDAIDAITDRPATLNDVYSVVTSPAAFEGMPPDELKWLFSVHNIKAATKKINDIRGRVALLDAVVAFLRYAKEQKLKLDFSQYGSLVKRAGLTEATFRELVDLTRSNGSYRIGGLRRVGNRWVIDPNVKNRFQNSAFVVPQIPNWVIGADGFTTMRFVVRSRPDRCTTGMNQTGFVRLLDDKAGLLTKIGRRIGGLFGKKQSALDRHVQVGCSCPDMRYRFHWVLAKMGAADQPTGLGNQPPNKTNPSHRPSLCKHLCAVSALLNVVPPPRGQVPVQPVAPNEPPNVDELSIMDEIED